MTPSESTASRTVLAVVRAQLSQLRPSERRIADALLADPARFSRCSIGEIADLAGTSTTTVVRFTRRIGYERFKDLRRDLTEQSLRDRMVLEGSGAQDFDISASDALGDVVAKIAASETLSLADTAELLDLAQLGRAVDVVAAARRVDVYGVGASAIVATDLQRKLSRIGRVALDWPESHAAWTAAAVLGRGAVALAISHSGATTDTIEFLRLARTSGATTIAVTNHEGSPLAAQAEVVLLTAARESDLRSGALGSRIAQLMVIDCLFVGVAQADYDATVDALRKTYDAVRPRTGG